MRERQEPVSSWVEEFIQASTVIAACNVVQRGYEAIQTYLSRRVMAADNLFPELDSILTDYIKANPDFDLKGFYYKAKLVEDQFRIVYNDLDKKCDAIMTELRKIDPGIEISILSDQLLNETLGQPDKEKMMKKVADLRGNVLSKETQEKIQVLRGQLEELEKEKNLFTSYIATATALGNFPIEIKARALEGYERSDEALEKTQSDKLDQHVRDNSQELETFYNISIENARQQHLIMKKLLDVLSEGEQLLTIKRNKYINSKKTKEGKDKDNDSRKAKILKAIIGPDTDRKTFKGLQSQIQSYLENTSQCKLVNQEERNAIFTNYSTLLNNIDQKVIAPLKKQHKERPFLTRLKNWFKHAFPFTHQSTVSVVRDVYSTLSFFHKHAQEKINEVERAAQEKINEVERINKPKIG